MSDIKNMTKDEIRTLEFDIFGAMIRGRITWPPDNTAELISKDITKAVLGFLKRYQ